MELNHTRQKAGKTMAGKQGLRLLAAALLAATATAGAWAQAPDKTIVKDSEPLKPPAGYRVAVVEWQDLECPLCAATFPVVKAAVEDTHVPWVEHDFPLHFHIWSFDAAVDARYIDQVKGHATGDEFRGQIFAAQSYLHSKEDVATMAKKFAAQHGFQWPFLVDPQGKIAEAVKADYSLGEHVGINHTPTVFVVTNGRNGAAQYTEVADRTRLESVIQTAIGQVGGVKDGPAAAVRTSAKKLAK